MILKNAVKIVYLSLPNLVCLASWRESFPMFECYRSLYLAKVSRPTAARSNADNTSRGA
jgi:hypothetical protein